MNPQDLFDKGTSLIWLLACGRFGNKPLLYQWWYNSLFHIFHNSAPMNQWVKVSSIVHRIFVILYDKLVEWSLSFCGNPFLFQNWQGRISLHYHWSIETKTKWRTPLRRYFSIIFDGIKQTTLVFTWRQRIKVSAISHWIDIMYVFSFWTFPHVDHCHILWWLTTH